MKDPAEVLDYKADWSSEEAEGGPWLEGGETIVTSTWAVTGGLVIDNQSQDSTTATVWLSGGTPGTARATNTVTTSAGRTGERSLRFNIQDR